MANSTASSLDLTPTSTLVARREDDVLAAVQGVLSATPAGKETEVAAFLAELADACEVRYARGVANRADALRVALLAVDARRGTEVIAASYGHSATAAAILQVGAIPRLIDIEANAPTMDPTRLLSAVSDRTAAIVVTHHGEHIADMDAIMEIAVEFGIPVIEDASASIGNRRDNMAVGSLGDLACFGFDEAARLHATGDAGAIVTNSGDLDNRIRQLTSPLGSVLHAPRELGWTSAIDAMQAAMLRVHLRHLDTAERTVAPLSVLHHLPAFADRVVTDDLSNTMARFTRF